MLSLLSIHTMYALGRQKHRVVSGNAEGRCNSACNITQGETFVCMEEEHYAPCTMHHYTICTMHYALCTEEGAEKTGGSHGDDTATCHPATARHLLRPRPLMQVVNFTVIRHWKQ